MTTARQQSISVDAGVFVPAERFAVFDVTTDHHSYPRFLHRVGLIPGVARSTIAGAGRPETGAHRKVWTTDGARFDETITIHERGIRHSYRWEAGPSGPRRPFSWLVRAGSGSWSYRDAPGGTRIEWTYRFEPTSSLAYPAAWMVAHGPFRRWMQVGLRRAAALFEKSKATATPPPILAPARPELDLVSQALTARGRVL